MFIIHIWRYLIGMVQFKCTGGFSERFLNLCAHNGIPVWEAKRVENGIIGYVSIANYRKFPKFRKKVGVKLKIKKRKGLPFILHRYRLRMGLLFGFVLFIAILHFLSLSIWSIEVEGNERVETEQIVMALDKLGLKQGVWRSKIDAETMRLQLVSAVPELSWAAINMNGCFATINVTEINELPDSANSDTPCNLKAAVEGRILKMNVLEGQPAVRVGEAVLEGDLLVSGAVVHQNGITIFKHASGSVIAETQRELSVEVPYEQVETNRTGEVVQKRVVSIFGINLPLYLGSTKGKYEKETERRDIIIDDVKLPFSITTARFYKLEENVYQISQDQAVALARERIAELEKTEFENKTILKSEEQIETENQFVRLTVKYICEEDIAMEELIMIDEGNDTGRTEDNTTGQAEEGTSQAEVETSHQEE